MSPCIDCHRAEIVDCFTEQTHPCASHAHEGDTGCGGCHEFDEIETTSEEDLAHRSRCGVASGYRLAMHGLCIDCHCVEQAEMGLEEPRLTRCGFCHRGVESDIRVTPAAQRKFAALTKLIE